MHPIQLAAAAFALALLSGGVSANPGDTLYAQVDGAAIRAEPAAGAAVLVSVMRGHKLIELRRVRGWVQVGAALTGGKIGWVSEREVSGLFSGGATVAPLSPEFSAFLNSMNALNADLAGVVGAPVFAGAVDKADGIVHVQPAPAWYGLSPDVQRQIASTLATIWARVEGSGLLTSVDIVRPDGSTIMMEHRGGN